MKRLATCLDTLLRDALNHFHFDFACLRCRKVDDRTIVLVILSKPPEFLVHFFLDIFVSGSTVNALEFIRVVFQVKHLPFIDIVFVKMNELVSIGSNAVMFPYRVGARIFVVVIVNALAPVFGGLPAEQWKSVGGGSGSHRQRRKRPKVSWRWVTMRSALCSMERCASWGSSSQGISS